MKKLFSLFLAVMLIFLTAGCTDAARNKAPKVKFNKKILKSTQLLDAGEKDVPFMLLREKVEDVTIFGAPVANQGQMINFIRKRNAEPKLNCTVEELVNFYYIEAGREGIRPDVAICQAIKETGTWNYGGDVVPEQNNYCGLGTTGGGVKGAYFETPQIGVRAHIQHLLAYATTTPPRIEIVDPRYELIEKWRPQIFGKIKTWTGLNGNWAVPGNQYGQDILNLWQQAQLPDASDASLEYADRQLFENPDKAAAYVYRGLVYYAQENFWGAQADFKTALEIEPNLSAAMFNLALAQSKLKRTDDAIATYDRYLKLEPESELGYYNRGHLKLSQNNFDDAIKDFERTLAIEGRFVDAQNEIAIAHFRQKKYADAWKDIQTAAEINTTNKIVNANKSKLQACIKK